MIFISEKRDSAITWETIMVYKLKSDDARNKGIENECFKENRIC